MRIESPQNPRVKALVALRDRKERERQRLFCIEGTREIAAAAQAGVEIREIFVCHEYLSDEAKQVLDQQLSTWTHGTVETEFGPRAFDKVAVREQSAGVLALAKLPERLGLEQAVMRPGFPLLIMDRVEKPGNLGAILRTADAAGISGLVLDHESVDPYSPNVIRASLGAVFTVPLFFSRSDEARAFCRDQMIQVVAAEPDASTLHFDVRYSERTAIVLGSEAFGISEAWLGAADVQLKIPMTGRVNSLNVSVATSVILYEIVRQRSQ